MALRKHVEKLEDVPEKYRDEYEADPAGGFSLKLEDAEDVGGLKSALEKERKAAREAERRFKEIERKFADLDPDKAREALAEVQKMQDKQLLDAGKVEELIRSRTERMAADHKAQADAAQKRIDELTAKSGALEGRLSELLVDGSLRQAADGKIRKGLTQAFIRLARAGDIDGIRWELRDGEPVPVAGDAIKYGKDASRPMTAEEYVELVRQKAPDLFEPSTGTGAKPNAASGSGQFTLTAAEARDHARYVSAKEAAAKAGQQVTIVN